MSCWTHVAAVIRLDALRFNEEQTAEQRKTIRTILGKECRWGSSDKTWKNARNHPDSYLPMGSEGSLELKLYINPDTSCLASYVITIFGDLRDRGYSKEELEEDYIEWFKTKLAELNKFFGIRQATITATNDHDTVNYTYDE